MLHNEILVQNIIVLGKKGEWEEGRNQNLNPSDTSLSLARLMKHFDFCAQYALRVHTLGNNSNEKSCELITRLTMNEFSCYPKNKPFSLELYKELIASIAKIAKTLPPNIHLILGTFPIKWSNGVIHNAGLHIQSPRNNQDLPIMHHFDKQNPFHTDPKYYKKNNILYPLYRLMDSENYYLTEHSPNKVLIDTAVYVNDINQYENAIKVITANGQSFIVAIDICFDHEMQVGLSNTIHLQQQLLRANGHMPKLGSHVIMSNSVLTHRDSLISRSFTHADPKAIVKSISEEVIDNPLFGNELKLIKCNIQKLNNLDEDNIYFFKDNLLFKRENVPSSNFFNSHTKTNYPDEIIDSNYLTVANLPEASEQPEEQQIKKYKPNILVKPIPINDKKALDAKEELNPLYRQEKGIRTWFLLSRLFLEKEYTDGTKINNDSPPLPLELILLIGSFVVGLSSYETEKIIKAINKKLFEAVSRNIDHAYKNKLFPLNIYQEKKELTKERYHKRSIL